MITEPAFYLAAVPGVLLFGISKGGFAGGFGIVTVPIMALVVSPAQAAAIMLPILLAMDLGAMWAYRADWDRSVMKTILPGGLAGTLLGTATFSLLSTAALKLLLGAIALGFVLHRWLKRSAQAAAAAPSRAKGALWASLSGLTSFIAHAGGPPLSVYLLPLKLAPAMLVGTTAFFFAAVNWSKVLPYAWLGLLSAENLVTAAVLAPVGLLGVWAGVRLRKVVDPVMFYRVVYGFLAFTGAKLLWDGVVGIAR